MDTIMNFDRLRIELVGDNDDSIVYEDDEIRAFEHDNEEITVYLSQTTDKAGPKTYSADDLVSIEIRRE